MDKADMVIGVIAKELESNADIHNKVLADMALDEEFSAVGSRLRAGYVLAVERFNELYDKHLRKYAIEEYHDRMNTESQRKIDLDIASQINLS